MLKQTQADGFIATFLDIGKHPGAFQGRKKIQIMRVLRTQYDRFKNSEHRAIKLY